ncbi:MAG: murein hydrolase activator EnvC family protein [Nocardioides sp.]
MAAHPPPIVPSPARPDRPVRTAGQVGRRNVLSWVTAPIVGLAGYLAPVARLALGRPTLSRAALSRAAPVGAGLGRAALLGLLGLGAVLACGAPATAADGDTPVGRWPLVPQPVVVARFDPPATAYGPGHRGVDLAGSIGQQVRAALPGRVIFAGSIAGKGVVVVNHGATRTTYEPVAAAVSVGTQVAAGQAIGTLWLPGSHCFPQACLHWGWLRGSVYLDPLRVVEAQRVRLLPLTDLPATLSARMSLLVGTPQTIGRDMGIQLGGRQ